MFGAYHVGAWKVLSQHFTPDLVVGVSIGSMNAYMVASGAPIEVIEQHWLDGEALANHRWRIPRRFGDGFVDPAAAHAIMRRMCSELQPKIPLAIVAREAWTFRPKIFRDGEITWRHIAASCAIPFVFDAQRIDGTLYVDGGLLDPLPLYAARDLGATEIVGVNCMSWGGRGLPCVVKLQASRDLRTLPRDVLYWSRERTLRWIAEGERDARAAIQRLQIQPLAR